MIKEINLTEEDVAKYYERENITDFMGGIGVGIGEYGKVALRGLEGKFEALAKGNSKGWKDVPYHKVGKLSLKKDLEQNFLVDDILDDDVLLVVVNGHAGTGKTFASLMGAFELGNDIFYTREAIEVGKELGFIPGDLGEKFAPYMRGYADNRREIRRLTGKTPPKNVTTEPLNYMRGGSFRHTTIIVDEAQNCANQVLKMAVSRCAEGSKAILLGSFEQIDNHKLTRESNGLKYVADRFEGQDIFKYHTLTKDKRSILAKLCDELL